MRRSVIAFVVVGTSLVAQAQAPAAFDVASVKPSAPNLNGSIKFGPGRLSVN